MSNYQDELRNSGDMRPGSASGGGGRVMAARKALEMQEKRKAARGNREGMVTISDINQPRTPSQSQRMLRRKESTIDGNAEGGNGSRYQLGRQGSANFDEQRMQEFEIGDGEIGGFRPGSRFHAVKKPGDPGYYEQQAAIEQRKQPQIVEQVVKPKPIQSRMHVSHGGAHDDDEEEQAPPPQARRAPAFQEREPVGRMHNVKGQRWDEDDAPQPELEVEEDTGKGRTHMSRRTLEEELDYEEPEDPPEESEAEKEAKRLQVLRDLEAKEKAEMTADKQKAIDLERKRQEARKMKEAALAKEQAKQAEAARRQQAQAQQQAAAVPDIPQGIYQGADPLTPTADWDISADVEAFLFTPPPKGMTVQCRVEREKGLLSKMNQARLTVSLSGQMMMVVVMTLMMLR
eukprot:TRINITY_DN7525_c0_g1_i1.p1 TRINITY_DN7525_c0_g1~~TRINITY_DN7525_c0_g1_i1.p1  ORF type:complete len:402 (+),score=181.85 TRINITY_DN7525_c0_g1_i1:141-1346(+)